MAIDEGVTDLWWPYSPQTGRYTTKVSGEQTDGRLLQILATEHRGAATPLHSHRDTDETWLVLDGEVTVWIGDERFELTAGGFAFGPMGVPHAFHVTSDEATILFTCSPAGTEGPEGYGIDGFFSEVCEPVVQGEGAPSPRQPDPEVFVSRMDAYGVDMVGPPPAL